MTVAELMEKLLSMPPDADVAVYSTDFVFAEIRAGSVELDDDGMVVINLAEEDE